MDDARPRVVDLLKGDAEETWSTRFGTTGRVIADEDIEAVWVSKSGEEIDPDWFSQPVIDLLVVIRGRLRVEFADPEVDPAVLEPGQVLILPANTRCRAYRWPRDSEEAAVFLAVYPRHSGQDGH